MGSCPICGAWFDDGAELNAHANSHWDDQDAVPSGPAAAPGAATVACPQCGVQVAAAELDSHALAHQLEAEEQQAAVAAPSAAARAAAEELDAQVAARLAAQEWGDASAAGPPAAAGAPAAAAAAEQLDAQVAAELAAQEWGEDGGDGSVGSDDEDEHHKQQLEALYFEELRARYGFSSHPSTRPGCCRMCGQAGHWVRDCPRNPDRQEAERRVLDPPTPHRIVSTQKQAAPTVLHAASCGANGATNGGSGNGSSSSSSGGGGSLVQLLASCLEQQAVPRGCQYHAALCGGVQHYGATPYSSGWGCGYNNMQMMSSYLLAARPEAKEAKEAKEALFGGCGWVPDIPALQAWLEAAWRAGFDVQGAEQLGGRVQGTQKWVGTTECAAVLRYFGLRAHIADFGVVQGAAGQTGGAAAAGAGGTGAAGSRPPQATAGTAAAGPRAASTAAGGPLPVHPGVQCDGCSQFPITGDRWRSEAVPDYDLCGACYAGRTTAGTAVEAAAAAGPFRRMLPTGLVMQQQQQQQGGASAAAGGGGDGGLSMSEQLLLWVWRYFTDDGADPTLPSSTSSMSSVAALGASSTSAGPHGWQGQGQAGNSLKRQRVAPRVQLTAKSPLYFQHEGHSRTIIGIERRVAPNGPPQFTLLILDPGTPGPKLAAALQQRHGWQRLLKRGPHTLRHSQYQLLWVEAGVAVGQELEGLKLVAARERY